MVGLAIIIAPVVRPPLSEWLAAATLATLTWSFAVDVLWLARGTAEPGFDAAQSVRRSAP
jgi:hypothetical protein